MQELFGQIQQRDPVDTIPAEWAEARSLTEKDRPEGLMNIGIYSRTFPQGERIFMIYKDLHNEIWYESKWKNEKSPA